MASQLASNSILPYRPGRAWWLLAGLAALAVPLAGCSASAQEESRVKSVEAKIDGLTCPTCVPPLTNSLHQQFDKAKIQVDDEKDTATVQFDEKQAFSDETFRQAASDVRMSVVYYRVQACGRIESSGTERWLKAGTNRFLVQSDQQLPVDKPLCLDGRVDPSKQPATFEVSAFELQKVN